MKNTMIIVIAFILSAITVGFAFQDVNQKHNVTIIKDTNRVTDVAPPDTVINPVDTVLSESQLDSITTTLSEYDQVYRWTKFWCNKYGVPYQVMLSISSKETGWDEQRHWVPVQSYSVKPGGRMDRANASCNGVNQMMMQTASYTAQLHNVKIPTRSELRHNIKINTQLATLHVRDLWNKYKNIVLVFNAYNSGNPKYGYGYDRINHLKTKYNLTQKQTEQLFK